MDPAPISIPKLETFIFQHYHLLLVLPRSTLTVMPQRKQTKGVLAKSVLNLSLHGLLGGAQISRSIYVLKVHCLLLAQFRLLDNFLSLEKVSKNMVDARSCFAGFFFPNLFIYFWLGFTFFSPFLFSSNYLCMDLYWLGIIVKFQFLLCKCSLSLQKILLFLNYSLSCKRFDVFASGWVQW